MEAGGEGDVWGGDVTMDVTVHVWKWSYNIFCVQNSPIVSLHEPATPEKEKSKDDLFFAPIQYSLDHYSSYK